MRKSILRHFIIFQCQNLQNKSGLLSRFAALAIQNYVLFESPKTHSLILILWGKNVDFNHSNFGIDLDGSNYFHFRRNVYFSVGPKKYKTSISKFIVVQRGPEA